MGAAKTGAAKIGWWWLLIVLLLMAALYFYARKKLRAWARMQERRAGRED
jgi:LPXTG-motif cell wall-anchored protein